MRKVPHDICGAFIFGKVSLIIRCKIIITMIEIKETINLFIIRVQCLMKRRLEADKKISSVPVVFVRPAINLGHIDLCFYIGLILSYYYIHH